MLPEIDRRPYVGVDADGICPNCHKHQILVKLCNKQRGSCRANVDACIAPLVKSLNDAGIETLASCCGHGKIDGNIALKDGRELIIKKMH